MTVRRLRIKQRGPACSYCSQYAEWRGCYFTKFACEEHRADLARADAEQAAADDHYHNGRQFAR